MLYYLSTTYPEDTLSIFLLSVSYLSTIFRRGVTSPMNTQVQPAIDAANQISEMTVAGVLALGLIAMCIMFYFYRKDVVAREMRLRDDKDRIHVEHNAEMKSLCGQYAQLAERSVSATLDSSTALESLTDALKLIFQEKMSGVNPSKRRT